MKTIGEYLTEGRRQKGLNINELAGITKIRASFLVDLENEKWQNLPEYPVVVGFVKSVAGVLDMNSAQAVALLRRDYPPKRVVAAPKAEIKREFRVSPQLAFFTGAGVVVVAIAAYLIFQYLSFVQAPMLVVEVPAEGQAVFERELTVSGSTSQGARVIVNTQPALVEADGGFFTTIEINESITRIEVVATSRAGKETRVVRTIKPEF